MEHDYKTFKRFKEDDERRTYHWLRGCMETYMEDELKEKNKNAHTKALFDKAKGVTPPFGGFDYNKKVALPATEGGGGGGSLLARAGAIEAEAARERGGGRGAGKAGKSRSK